MGLSEIVFRLLSSPLYELRDINNIIPIPIMKIPINIFIRPKKIEYSLLLKATKRLDIWLVTLFITLILFLLSKINKNCESAT